MGVRWVAAVVSAVLATAPAPLLAQSADVSALEMRGEEGVVRLTLEATKGVIGGASLSLAGTPTLSIELVGANFEAVRGLVQSLASLPALVRELTVVPGLDGNVVLMAQLTKPVRVLDETVAATADGRSRWELVLAEAPEAASVQSAPVARAALSGIAFDTQSDRLDILLQGSDGLVAEVSLADSPSSLIVELPGISRAEAEDVALRAGSLPAMVRRVEAASGAGGAARLVFELRGPVDLIDTGGSARNGRGFVRMSVVPDAAPDDSDPASAGRLSGLTTEMVNGELQIGLDGGGAARVSTFTLGQPPRLVIDLLGWRPDQVTEAVRTFASTHPVVGRAAVTETRLGSARVVVSLATQVAIEGQRYGGGPTSGGGRVLIALGALHDAASGFAMAGIPMDGRRITGSLDRLRRPEVTIRPVALDDAGFVEPEHGMNYGLLQALETALLNDAKYGAARAAYEAAAEAIPQARAGYLPVADFEYQASALRQNVSGGAYASTGGGSFSYPTQRFSLTITQPLLRAQAWVRMDQAKLSVAQAELSLLAAEQDLMLRLGTSYLDVLASHDGLDLALAERDATVTQLELAQERLQSGLGNITQLHEMEARYALTEARVIEAENKVEDARAALKEILGGEVAAVSGFRTDFLAVPPVPASAEAWARAAGEQNLSVQARALALEIAELETKRQKAGHLPTVDLVGSIGRDDQNNPLYSSRQETMSGQVGVRVRVPLYQGGLTSSLVRESVARSVQVSHELEEERRRTERLARSAFMRVQASVRTLEALRVSVHAQESALQAKLEGLRAGITSIVAVVDAYRIYYAAQRDYLQARHDYLVNRLRLKQAVGNLGRSDIEDLAILLR